MAGKDLTYTVGVDASDAVSGLRKLESAVRSTMRDVEGELDESASAGDKFAASIDRLSAQMKEDFNSSAIAAEELQRALRDAGSGLDVGDALTELNRMGISMDEVTADADKFAQSLKQLDDVRVTGVKELDGIAPGLATKLNDVNKSADSSKGALANMIGNSAQDLGELGGVAGSAGVAVGQMAEYFADAAFSGEGLKSVMSSFANVAGPILLITAAVSAVTGAMQANQKRTEQAAQTTEQFGDAMAGAADDSLGLAESMRENESALREFDATSLLGTGTLGKFANTLNDAGKAVPILGGLFQDLSVDIIKALGDSGNSMYEFASALSGTSAERAKWLEDVELMHAAGFITSDQFHALQQAFGEQSKAVDKARAAQKLYNVTAEEANAILQESADPLEQHTDLWNVLFDDLADGTIDTKEAANAVNVLADELGLMPTEVIATATEEYNRQLEEQAQRSEEAAQAAKEHAKAVTGAEAALQALMTQGAVWTQRGGIISGLLGDAAGMSEAKANVRDIATAIGEIPAELAKVKVGDVLANATSADALLDKLDSIGTQVRERIADAFATGGPDAANQMAADYVAQVTAALGGKFTSEQVAEMLGLGDVKATIDLAVSQDAIARAKATIDAVTGVSGETPFTATVGLAIDAGTLSASAGQAIANWQAQEAGINVPFEPVTDPAAIDEANAFMSTYAAAHPPTVPLEGDSSGVLATADKAVDTVEGKTATVPIDADASKAEDERKGFADKTNATKPVVGVDADTKAALATMVYLKIFSALLAPSVSVTADISSAMASLAYVGSQRPRVPVEAYLADYPTSTEIANRIGRPRIPVDIVVGSSIRITGVRE